MAEQSFSSKLKEQLNAEIIKKKCCKYIFKKVIESKENENGMPLKVLYENCRCDTCKIIFSRALFIVYGSVTNPEKGYHLDFLLDSTEEAEFVTQVMEEAGFDFRVSLRRDKAVAYIKESAMIEDFLVFIGASTAAFEVMNSKIVREFRNSVNRQVNCDTANIAKQLAASKKYTAAIEKIIESGKYDSLSSELKEAIKLRLENEQLSFADLGALANPPVTKSGMKHRLEKLLSISEDIDKE